MAGFNTSSIHGQSTLKLEQFYDIVLMRSWHFMVFYTLRFRYFPFSLFSVYVYACASSGQLHCCLLRCAHIYFQMGYSHSSLATAYKYACNKGIFQSLPSLDFFTTQEYLIGL